MTCKHYTREFKLKAVQAVESGELRPAQACREYQLAESVLARWRQEVRERGEAAFTPPTVSPTDVYEQRIAELDSFGCVVNSPLRMSALKKALQRAQSRLATKFW